MNIPMDAERQRKIKEKYADLLCDDCKIKLSQYAIPIADRLKKGRQARTRDMLRLMNTLCPACFEKILRRMKR